MNIENFAAQYRLKLRRCPDDGTDNIYGRFGHIYEYSENELGLCFMPDGEPRPRKWGSVRQACLAAGMTLRQNGDAEGCLSFSPENGRQAKLAIRLLRVRPKRQVSAEQLARLAEMAFKRKPHAVGGHLTA